MVFGAIQYVVCAFGPGSQVRDGIALGEAVREIVVKTGRTLAPWKNVICDSFIAGFG